MRRGLVLAHHDPAGIVDPHVVHALGHYRRHADHVTLVSTAARRLPPAAADLVDAFIPRENVGYDFCSWRAGLDALPDRTEFDELVLVNDSVYGPLSDLAPAFSDPRVADADCWGMCLSAQDPRSRRTPARPHLQSWFVVFRRVVVESGAFRIFWEGVEPLATKAAIVDRYEVGMSERLAAAGFRLAALYDATRAARPTVARALRHLSPAEPLRSWRLIRKLGAARCGWHNPSEAGCEALLEAGVPFIKTSVFRVNHYGLDRRILMRRIAACPAYDPALVEGHLRRLAAAGPG